MNAKSSGTSHLRHSGFGEKKPMGHKMNPSYRNCDKMIPAGFNFGLRVSLMVIVWLTWFGLGEPWTTVFGQFTDELENSVDIIY